MFVVAHVVLSLNVGGLEKVVLRLLERIDRARFAPIVCALDEAGSLAGELDRLGVPLHVLPRRRGLDPSLVFELAALFRREHVAVVHTHNPTPHLYGALAAAVASRSARTRPRLPRAIHTKHGRNELGSKRKILVNRIAAAFTDVLVAVGKDTRSVIVDVERVDPAKVVVIPNGVDSDEFRPSVDRASARARLQLPREAFVIGCVARLAPEKGHETLLRAFAAFRSIKPDAHLVLLGDGPSRPRLEELASELRLGGAAHFAGTRDDVAQVLHAFDVFALASRTEGIALTLLEAACAGLPIVATRVGGTPEIVVDGETGLLVRADDPRGLTNALLRVAQDPAAQAMGLRGRARIIERFGVDEMVRGYERLYDKVLGIACDPAAVVESTAGRTAHLARGSLPREGSRG
jgi:sugar transferase (PEP-CTERM/EpsH1 system associated)